jgi:hypothetical protein
MKRAAAARTRRRGVAMRRRRPAAASWRPSGEVLEMEGGKRKREREDGEVVGGGGVKVWKVEGVSCGAVLEGLEWYVKMMRARPAAMMSAARAVVKVRRVARGLLRVGVGVGVGVGFMAWLRRRGFGGGARVRWR